MTDNTKAIEKLAEIIAGDRAVEHDTIFPSDRDLAQTILAAIQADPMAYVKPKPLEWEGSESDCFASSDTPLGQYTVCVGYENEWGAEFECHADSLQPYNITAILGSMGDAKAAAYEHYCKQVGELHK